MCWGIVYKKVRVSRRRKVSQKVRVDEVVLEDVLKAKDLEGENKRRCRMGWRVNECKLDYYWDSLCC